MRCVSPKNFARLRDNGHALCFKSPQGNVVSVSVLEHNLVRVRHQPNQPQSSEFPLTFCVAPPTLPPAGTSGRLRSEETGFAKPSVDVRERVAADATRFYDVRTKELTATARLSPEGDLTLFWTAAGSEAPFCADLPFRAYTHDLKSGAVYHYVSRHADDIYVGCGERTNPIPLNGRRLRLACMDSAAYNAKSTDPLYKHVPFLITLSGAANGACYGIFYDNLSQGVLDLGAEVDALYGDYRYYQADHGSLDYYMIYGPSVEKVVETYASLVGLPALPPRYALGYLASAKDYGEADNAQELIENFPTLLETYDIPCDGLHLSSGYTVNPATNTRNIFTWNHQRFPDPKKMFASLRVKGVRVIANVKPYLLKVHPHYNQVASMAGFQRDPDTDAPALTRLWSAGFNESGQGSLLDFSSPGGFQYWVNNIQGALLDYGVAGIWNDNNEYGTTNDDDRLNIYGGSATIGLAGRPLQTLLMAEASTAAMRRFAPRQRPFLVSRSACPGVHRLAGQTWSGDNFTSWETLRYNVPMGANMGLSLFAGYGHDVGGFAGPTPSPELLVRWIQNGIYHPRFCIHSWKSPPFTEPWMYPEVLPIIRDQIKWRYRLLPYLYNLYMEAHRTGHPIIRPMFYHFQNEPRCRTEPFDFMLGPHLLVASVLDEGARQRKVYLPGDLPWCELRTGEWYKSGQEVVLPAPLESFPVLVRAGAILPTGKVMQHVGAEKDDVRIAFVFPAPDAVRSSSSSNDKGTANDQQEPLAEEELIYVLHEDDGESTDVDASVGAFAKVTLRVRRHHGNRLACSASAMLSGGFALPYDRVWFVLPHGDSRELISEQALRGGVSSEPERRIGGPEVDGRMMLGVSVVFESSS